MTDSANGICAYHSCNDPIDSENIPLDGGNLRYCPRHTKELNEIVIRDVVEGQVGGSLDVFRWYIGACGPLWSLYVNA